MVEMSVLTNLIYRFKTIPIEIPAGYFVDKAIPKCTRKSKKTRIATTTLKRKNKVGESHDPILRLTIKLQKSKVSKHTPTQKWPNGF